MDDDRITRGEAGTDLEYFELLDARRRELARQKNASPTPADACEPAAERRDPEKRTDRPPQTQSTQAHPAQPQPRPTQTRPRPTQSRPAQSNPTSTRREPNRPEQARPARPQRPAPQANAQRGRSPAPQGSAPARVRPDSSHPSVAAPPRGRGNAPAAQRGQAAAQRQIGSQRPPLPRRPDDPIARAEAERRRAEAEHRRIEAAKRREAEEARQREIRRRIKEKKRAELAARAAAVGENLLLFLIVLMISASLLASAMAIRLVTTASGEGRDTRGFTYTVCGKTRRLDRDEVMVGDIPYLDLTEIAELLEIGISGTTEELIFETPDGECAAITPGRLTAVVNGNPVMLEGAPRRDEDTSHIWVPLSFVCDYILGIDASLEEVERRGSKALVITIERVPDPDAFGEAGVLMSPAFTLKAATPAERISISDAPDTSLPPAESAPNYEFLADLSGYERYMSPTMPERDEYLLQVNDSVRLGYSYTPAALTTISASAAQDTVAPPTLSLYAARALEAMILEGRAAGYPELAAARGYTSYEDAAAQFDGYLSTERNFSSLFYAATGKRFSDRAYAALGQEYLNENYISKKIYTLSLADARRVVLTYATEPGCDEHQSGLAVDLCDTSPAAAAFADSRVYSWLCENAHKFGFILRYPADKTDKTGHAAEPWHFRYVGRYHAERMYSSGLCLEEYLSAMAAD